VVGRDFPKTSIFGKATLDFGIFTINIDYVALAILDAIQSPYYIAVFGIHHVIPVNCSADLCKFSVGGDRYVYPPPKGATEQ
jgi:hypothetical protein